MDHRGSRDQKKLRKVFSDNKDIVGIIHFAALKSVGESMEKPLWYFKNKSLKVDIGIIVCTAISIILPKSLVHEKIFSGIPEVPEKLKEYIVKESSL